MRAVWRELDELQRDVARISAADVPLVVARAETAAGPTMTNLAYTIVNYATVLADPYALITTGASWACTPTIGGTYLVRACVLLPAFSYTAIELRVFVAGSGGPVLDRRDTTGAVQQFLGGSALVSVTPGQAIDVRCYQDSGANRALVGAAAYTYVHIARLNG